MHSYHAYTAATIQPGYDCSVHYSWGSNFIVLSQWVMVNLSGSDPQQIELGHAQQCNNENFVFWGYWYGGVFRELDYIVRAPDPNGHTFQIYRLNGVEWKLHVRLGAPVSQGQLGYHGSAGSGRS